MLAKCAKCQEVFQTDRYGRQFCPKCGSELMLPPPSSAAAPPANEGTPPSEPASQEPAPSEVAATAKPHVPASPPITVPPPPGWSGGGSGGGFGAPPPPPPGDGPQDQPTPWEERATRGTLAAIAETVRMVLFDPLAFFGRMRVDHREGAVSYFWIVAGIGSVAAQLWSAVMSMGRRQQIPTTLPDGQPFPYAEQLQHVMDTMNNPRAHLTSAIAYALFAPVMLFISAGIIHVGAMIFGAAKNGFTATLKAVAYAYTPHLLNVIPFCGALISPFWTLGLFVIGLWKVQRTSVGQAIGAVLVPLFVACCCFMILGGMAFMAALGSLAGAASAASP